MNLEFSKNLKKLRRNKDLTQEDLAEKLSLSTQSISRYETGTAYPDIEMLPVIAGFFGVTVDNLLGVSSEAKERRMEEYYAELQTITDRKERLSLLRRQHAEFPEAWGIVSNMVHEMTFIPECLDEIRQTVNDAMKHCDDTLCRENMIFFYLHAEPDEKTAVSFINKYCSRYDLSRAALLDQFYCSRGAHEKRKSVLQKKLKTQLEESFYNLLSRTDCDIRTAKENCENILGFIDSLSLSSDRTKPDMWINIKLRTMFNLANNCFALSEKEEGFSVLEDVVSLFENFFALKNGTVLTHGTSKFDTLSAKINRHIYYHATEFTGLIATSIMTDLYYLTPVGPIDEDQKIIRDMEGFEREMVFSGYFNKLINASWDGFMSVKEDPRYIDLANRVKKISSIESLDNMLFLIESYISRTDDWAKEQNWVCALIVKNVGAYVIFSNPNDFEEMFNRMVREKNTSVSQIIAGQFGGDIIAPPENILQRVVSLDKENSSAQVILKNEKGEIVFSTVNNLLT